jgi:hypothetical protein
MVVTLNERVSQVPGRLEGSPADAWTKETGRTAGEVTSAIAASRKSLTRLIAG